MKNSLFIFVEKNFTFDILIFNLGESYMFQFCSSFTRSYLIPKIDIDIDSTQVLFSM